MTLTPEMVEILPCPFCGGEAEFIQDTCEAYVECTNDMCGACSGNFGYHSGDQKAHALAAWNARAQSQRTVGWMPIETAPKDETPVDLWVPNRRDGRLVNMRRVQLGKHNVFYQAIEVGPSCVRDATHWMPIPNGPDIALIDGAGGGV